MPFCLHPGCSVRVARGRCDSHQRLRDRQQGASASARGYGWTWQTRALAFLVVHRLCGMRPGGRAPVMSACHEAGVTRTATVVDHVEPHRGDQVKFWDEVGNWQALCRECHLCKTSSGL